MIEVTERAIDELAQMREQANLGPDVGVGIVPRAGALSLPRCSPALPTR